MLPRLFLTVMPVYSPQAAKSWNQEENTVWLKMNVSDGVLSFRDEQLHLNDEQAINSVVERIDNCPNMRVLDFRGNTLGTEGKDRIAAAIQRHPELEECMWSDMFTGRLKHEIPPILMSLCNAMMQANCKITELDLSDNAFGPIGADGIADFLVSPSAYHLKTLRLNNNGLGAGGIKIAECLMECSRNAIRDKTRFKLKRFIAGRNRLEDPGAQALADAFICLGTLEEIRLPQNGIRPDGITALTVAFSKNLNLKIIDINDNTCTVDGALAISEVLPSLTHLEVLELGDCLCRDDGAFAILAGLDQDRSDLSIVNLSGNELTVESVEEIGVFFSAPNMQHIQVNLSCNNFGSQFHDLKEAYAGDRNLDFGDSDDDQGSLSGNEYDEEDDEYYDEEEQPAEDMSMEEDNDPNTSRETVIDRSINRDTVDEQLDALVNQGFGCMKIDNQKTNGILSFLDQKLKLDTLESAEPIAQKIESTKFMQVLELKGNTIGVEAGERLARALRQHPELERCLWSDIFTGRLKNEIPPVLIAFGKAMINAKCQISELDLSDNAFGPIGAEGIAELLESPTAFTLEVLKLNNNGLGSGGKKIASSLSTCLQKSIEKGRECRLRLKTFIAGRNRLENPGATALAATFKAMETLEVIQMPQNGINKEGIIALADSLKFNRNLRVLNLNDNTTTEIGATAIAKILDHLPKLEVLDLGDCLCRDSGCHAIIDALSPAVHRQLKEVNLSGAEMSPAAARLISKKWEKFDNLQAKPTLIIGSNNFGDMFSSLKTSMPQNIDMGESDDDCGSLSSDDEERNSGRSSDGDEEDEGNDSVVEVNAGAGDSDVAALIKSCYEKIDLLKINFESRVQDETARVILNLVQPIKLSKCDPQVYEKALNVVEDIVIQVAAVKRNPIPPTTQLINNIVAQCKTLGVKPEEDWGIPIDIPIMGKMLRDLLGKGHFPSERQMILNFFPPSQ